MPKDQIKEILAQIADHERRLKSIEGAARITPTPSPNSKQRTLREIVKGRKFKNGQEQLCVIVGYHEMVVKSPIAKTALKEEWLAAKMLNKYDGKFLERAKDVFFRIHPDDTCVLTQTGEDFFEQFLKNESLNSTSK